MRVDLELEGLIGRFVGRRMGAELCVALASEWVALANGFFLRGL